MRSSIIHIQCLSTDNTLLLVTILLELHWFSKVCVILNGRQKLAAALQLIIYSHMNSSHERSTLPHSLFYITQSFSWLFLKTIAYLYCGLFLHPTKRHHPLHQWHYWGWVVSVKVLTSIGMCGALWRKQNYLQSSSVLRKIIKILVRNTAKLYKQMVWTAWARSKVPQEFKHLGSA